LEAGEGRPMTEEDWSRLHEFAKRVAAENRAES
jgi:hypothetical protein